MKYVLLMMLFVSVDYLQRTYYCFFNITFCYQTCILSIPTTYRIILCVIIVGGREDSGCCICFVSKLHQQVPRVLYGDDMLPCRMKCYGICMRYGFRSVSYSPGSFVCVRPLVRLYSMMACKAFMEIWHNLRLCASHAPGSLNGHLAVLA